MRVKLSRRARWLVPGTAIAVTAGVIAAFAIPAAEASPVLPARTPAQLLAEISSDAHVPPLTGTVVETTSLGLPQLPGLNDPTSLASLLTGSHTVNVYYQDAKHFRLQVPSPAAETDFVRNGSTLWLWDSSSDSVTKFTLPAPTAKTQQVQAPGTPVLTPQQAASEVLNAVGKTTLVSLKSNVMVAGQASYQLVLAPKDHRSLIGEVTIAIDAQYGVPLQVQVFAKGGTSPAFQVGYTNLQFVAPAAANFDFTPPPGAKIKVENFGTEHGSTAGANGGGGQSDLSGFGTYGNSWLTVVELPSSDLLNGLQGGGGGGQASANPGGGPGGVLAGDSQAVLNAILGSAKPVSGSWGSGTLVTTTLVSILMTGGEVYVGAVQPSVLYAAVGHTSS